MGGEERARIPAAGIAAWVAVVAGAAATAVELALSGTTELLIALPTMVGIHAIIGIGEAIITMAALGFIAVTRKDLFTLRDAGLTTAQPRATAGI
jgi:cobalt/nickel transport system permease protein